MRENIKIELN